LHDGRREGEVGEHFVEELHAEPGVVKRGVCRNRGKLLVIKIKVQPGIAIIARTIKD